MNFWMIGKNFNETSLLQKEEFYSNLNMAQNILQILLYTTEPGYDHSKRTCKDFKIKHLGPYYELHLKIDTLLLADFFKTLEKCA